MLGKIKLLSSPVEIEHSETRFGKGRSRATRKTPLDNGVLPVDSTPWIWLVGEVCCSTTAHSCWLIYVACSRVKH